MQLFPPERSSHLQEESEGKLANYITVTKYVYAVAYDLSAGSSGTGIHVCDYSTGSYSIAAKIYTF